MIYFVGADGFAATKDGGTATPLHVRKHLLRNNINKPKSLLFSLTLVIGQGFRPVPPSFESLCAVRLQLSEAGRGVGI